MRSGSNFKNTPAVLIILRVDASKFKSLTSSTWGYVSNTNKSKETWLFQRMKVKSRAVVFWFPNDMKGQRVAHITQVTCFENILRICRFIYPIFFFTWCVVEMIDLPWSVVSLGEAMYQNAFLSLEFRVDAGKNCACMTLINCSVNYA